MTVSSSRFHGEIIRAGLGSDGYFPCKLPYCGVPCSAVDCNVVSRSVAQLTAFTPIRCDHFREEFNMNIQAIIASIIAAVLGVAGGVMPAGSSLSVPPAVWNVVDDWDDWDDWDD